MVAAGCLEAHMVLMLVAATHTETAHKRQRFVSSLCVNSFIHRGLVGGHCMGLKAQKILVNLAFTHAFNAGSSNIGSASDTKKRQELTSHVQLLLCTASDRDKNTCDFSLEASS